MAGLPQTVVKEARFFREDFDRERDFVAVRPFTYGPKTYDIGEPVDKAVFTGRRLRQLYDMRNIGYPTPEQVAPTLEVPPAAPALALDVPEGGVVVTAYSPAAAVVVPGTVPRRRRVA